MRTVLLFILLSLSVIAQNQVKQLPENITAAFMARNPDFKIDDWSFDNGLYSLEFYKRGSMFTSVFDQDGVWKETAEIISDMNLPSSIQVYIKKNYPSGTIGYCEEVETSAPVHFLRVNLIDGNRSVVLKSDKDGNDISLENPGG